MREPITIRRTFVWSAVVAIALALPSADATTQWTAEKPGSDNITVLSHLPLGPRLSVSDIDLEQELDRPYAYVGRIVYGSEGDKGIDIIDLHDNPGEWMPHCHIAEHLHAWMMTSFTVSAP